MIGNEVDFSIDDRLRGYPDVAFKSLSDNIKENVAI